MALYSKVAEKECLLLETSTIALIIIGVLLILYISEIMPIAATSVLACLAMAIFGVIPFATAFRGFGNDIVFLVIGMMIVGNALFETGAAQVVGRLIISKVGSNERVFLAALIVVSIPISAFLSNTATAAIMLPLAGSAIAVSKGKFTKKNTYMIVGIAAVAGGGLTLVSSMPQLIAQQALIEGGHETMGFFDITLAGAPILLLLIIYALTIGYRLQKKVFNFEEVPDVFLDAKDDKPKSVKKMLIATGALVFCVAGFIADIWSLGVVAMLGAVACVATGCISQKQVYKKMDWNTIVVFGCSFGFAAGLDESGAGRLIAQTAISIMGDNATPFLLCVMLALVAVVLSNFMSTTGTAALLIPIAIFTAVELNFDVRSIALATAVAVNIGYATPLSTPPLTMTLPAGYRFMDYVKIGGLFNIMALLLLVALFPFILNL